MNVLEVKDLEKSFGRFKAVGGVSFHVKQGEIVGFIGPNGAGKTTTLKLVTNLLWPDKGTITICGYDLMTARKQALSSISGIIENPGLYSNLTGLDNLLFIQKIRKISDKRMLECIEMTNLGEHLKKTVQKYSLGMKQRLALGMAMLTEPKLLILDEPTNGLDPTGIIELRKMLANMAATGQTSIFFSSHQLGEVEKLANRVIYIKEGKITRELDRLDETEDLEEIYNDLYIGTKGGDPFV